MQVVLLQLYSNKILQLRTEHLYVLNAVSTPVMVGMASSVANDVIMRTGAASATARDVIRRMTSQ